MNHANKPISEWSLLMAAIMFYTRLPTPKKAPHSDEILNRSRKYFPVVGLIIGGIGATVFYFAHQVFSHSISVLLSMIATILATGAFHEDGFADSCDGLGGGWTKEQVLTIMKDSRVGAYATVGLMALLALKFFSLLDLSSMHFSLFASLMVAAHVLSRKMSSIVIERYDYVQDIDVSKVKPITDRRLSSQDLLTSTVVTTFVLLILALQAFAATLIAVAIAFLIAHIFARYSLHRIGGYTGDILGAIQQLSEVFFYLSFLAALGTF